VPTEAEAGTASNNFCGALRTLRGLAVSMRPAILTESQKSAIV
jgi:hypothetical protein